MGKTSKWLRNFLSGKKDKKELPSNQNFSTTFEYPATPISIRQNSKEKKRWSFRRSAAAVSRDSHPLEMVSTTMPVAQAAVGVDNEEKGQGLAMLMAKAVAADAAVAAAIRLTEVAHVKATAFEEAAAIKIQSVFRSYLVPKLETFILISLSVYKWLPF